MDLPINPDPEALGVRLERAYTTKVWLGSDSWKMVSSPGCGNNDATMTADRADAQTAADTTASSKNSSRKEKESSKNNKNKRNTAILIGELPGIKNYAYNFVPETPLNHTMWPIICDLSQFEANMKFIHAEIPGAPVVARVSYFRGMWSGWLENALVRLVYGSNMIDSAGCYDFEKTREICGEVFAGRETTAMIKHDISGDLGRREVYNHAMALRYAIKKVVIQGGDITEDLIKEVHKLLQDRLTDYVGDGHGGWCVIPGGYGEYRNHRAVVKHDDLANRADRDVAGDQKGEDKKKARRRECARHDAIKGNMEKMTEELKADVKVIHQQGAANTSADRQKQKKQADQEKERKRRPLDPYSLAAKYSHQFAMIRPFGAGNGRVSRIILNVLLLKYAGRLAPFGGDAAGEERWEYLTIMALRGKKWHDEDTDVAFEEQTSQLELAKYILEKSECFEQRKEKEKSEKKESEKGDRDSEECGDSGSSVNGVDVAEDILKDVREEWVIV